MNTENLPKYDVVSIGSATVDHFADTDSELIKIATRTTEEALIAFPLGSKLLIQDLRVTTGGGGTNTAVSFSRLGLKTGFLGKIGDDANGEFVQNRLAEESVTFLGGCEGQTGFSVILNSIEQDRSILAFKGSNDFLKTEDIQPFESRWFYLSSMLGESFDTVQKLLQSHSGQVAFNPSNYQAKLGYPELMPILKRVELLIVNREEACALLGHDFAEDRPVPDLIRELAEKLPCGKILITDGKAGAWASDREKIYHGLPVEGIKICETTGAGDAFGSSFTGALIRGKSMGEALNYAMTNAESVLQHKGAKERLLSWEEVEQKIAQENRHISSEGF